LKAFSNSLKFRSTPFWNCNDALLHLDAPIGVKAELPRGRYFGNGRRSILSIHEMTEMFGRLRHKGR